MTTLISTPAQVGAVFARQFIFEVTDLCYRGPRHPIVEPAMAWHLARYGNNAEYWRMAMIQLMVRARLEEDQTKRLLLWNEIGTYLLDEASPGQLQDDVLWHFQMNVNVKMEWTVNQIVMLRRRVRKLGQQLDELPIAA